MRAWVCAAVALLLCAGAAWADDRQAEATGAYGYLMARADRFADLQSRWGMNTLQLPQGVLALNLDWNMKQASDKYDADGKLAPILEDFAVDDPFGMGGHFLEFFWDPEYRGTEYGFGLRYGILDSLDAFIDMPFKTYSMKLRPRFNAGTCTMLGVRDLDDYWRMLEMLGRSEIGAEYSSGGWEMGDLSAGLSWNWLRADYISFAGTARVFVPTGRLADPNESLAYGTGAQLDVGSGSWAPGAGFALDWRMPEPVWFISGSIGFDYAYYLPAERDYPDYAKPDPSMAKIVQQLGPGNPMFADFSALQGDYTFTPGHRVGYEVGIGFDFKYAGINFTYNWEWGQEPDLDTDSEQFEQMIELIGVYTESTVETLNGSVFVPFERFAFPLRLDLGYSYSLAGKDVLHYEPDCSVQMQLFFPF